MSTVPAGKLVKDSLGGLHTHLFATGENPDLALVLLHGYGAKGDDLVYIGQILIHSNSLQNRHVLLVCPEGPISFPHGGKAWWNVDRLTNLNHYRNGEAHKVHESVPDVHLYTHPINIELLSTRSKIQALLSELETKFKISPAKVIIGGFSQGAMLSVDTVLTAPNPPLVAIAMSGSLRALNDWREGLPARKNAKFFISHGEFDNVVPFSDGVLLAKILKDNGNEVRFETFQGAHTIPNQVTKAVVEFLGKVVKEL